MLTQFVLNLVEIRCTEDPKKRTRICPIRPPRNRSPIHPNQKRPRKQKMCHKISRPFQTHRTQRSTPMHGPRVSRRQHPPANPLQPLQRPPLNQSPRNMQMHPNRPRLHPPRPQHPPHRPKTRKHPPNFHNQPLKRPHQVKH